MIKFDKDIITIFVGVALFLLILGIGFIVLASYYIKKRKQHFEEKYTMKKEFEHQLLQSQIEVQEHTSNTLGKELHDNVGQLLTTTKMLMGLSERELEHVPDTLITAQETIGKAINELRTLAKSLDKDWLSRFSFIENMEQEAARINASRNTQLNIEYDEKILPINTDEQIMLFRIVQEAVQNAIKHGAATIINLTLKTKENLLHVSVTDNGKGFLENENKNNGMGLSNIKHRITVLGGTLQIHSHPGDGTDISLQLPINKNL